MTERLSIPVPRSPTPPPPAGARQTENPAIKALTLALRDNAADLTTQDKAVREAEATLAAAQNQMTALRTEREGLQAALAVLRGEPVT